MSVNIVNSVIHRMYNGRNITNEADRTITKLECSKVLTFNSNSDEEDTQVLAEPDVPVYTCKFCPTQQYSNILAVADENGVVSVMDVKSDHLLHVASHNNTIFDLNWMPNDRKYVTVSGDHSAKLWAMREGGVQLLGQFMDHNRSVKCVSFKPKNTAMFATGSRDGSVLLWDTRSILIRQRVSDLRRSDQIIPVAAGVGSSLRYKKNSRCNSVTSLVFQDDNNLFVASSSDSAIYVWDMRRTYSRNSVFTATPKIRLFAPNAGFSNLCVSPCGSKLYANCMDSHIYCYNINSCDPDPIAAFCGHQNSTFYVKACLSHDGQYLMSGSSNNLAYVWNTTGAEKSATAVKPIMCLPGHTAEVTCVDMSCSGDMTVATSSDDGTYRLWHPYRQRSNEETKTQETAVPPTLTLFDDALAKPQWVNTRVANTANGKPTNATPRGECDRKICRYINAACRRGRHTTTEPPDEENRTPPSRKMSGKRKTPEVTTEERRKEVLGKRQVLSPMKEETNRGVGIEELASPTANLPNYIMDGLSPYSHRCAKRPKQSADWLTSMQRTKFPSSATTSATALVCEEKKSCGMEKSDPVKSVPKRRTSRSRSDTAQDRKPVVRTLFQYFPKSNKV